MLRAFAINMSSAPLLKSLLVLAAAAALCACERPLPSKPGEPVVPEHPKTMRDTIGATIVAIEVPNAATASRRRPPNS